MKDKLDNLIKAAHEYSDSFGCIVKLSGIEIDLTTGQLILHTNYTPPAAYITVNTLQGTGAFNQVFCDGGWCDIDGD